MPGLRKPLPSISTRTEAFVPRELPLTPFDPEPTPASTAPALVRAERAERIRAALRRWLEEEL